MTFKLLTCLSLAVCLACSPTDEKKSISEPKATDDTFNPEKWRTREKENYPHRKAMLDDLVKNQQLKSLRHKEVITLLGQPDRTDSAYIFYKVDETRIQFMVLNSKTLVIKFNPDSTVNWVKIHG